MSLETGIQMQIETQFVTLARAAGSICVKRYGDPVRPVVFMAHSILSSSVMWSAQARLLARLGWHVVCADTRGHGGSIAPTAPASMQDLADDTLAVLEAIDANEVHYVGLSLGGMSGFALALSGSSRLKSLVLCDARADTPVDGAAVWEDRISVAVNNGCSALASPTLERWFGRPFLDAHPELEKTLLDVASSTSVTGFVGCARAIVGLDYLGQVSKITLPTTLIVGGNDGVLPSAMADIQRRIAGSELQVIPQGGHLPNIDQPQAFNAAVLQHLERHR